MSAPMPQPDAERGAREELAAIQERVLDATSLPWLEVATLHPDGRRAYGVTSEAEDDVCEMPYTPQGSADARFIAHARTDVPRLVKALEAVLETADEWAASPAVGASSEEQWELDTLRIVAATLRHDITEALTTDTKGDAR